MAKKILSIIIGALLALLLFVLAVLLGTNTLGFQTIAVLELLLNIIIGFICWKKFTNNQIARNFAFGAMCGSIIYLVIIFIAKTVMFSLLNGIAS